MRKKVNYTAENINADYIKLKMKINLFKYPKLIEILKYLYSHKDSRVVDVSNKGNIQYSYVSSKIKFLKAEKLIETKKRGRETYVVLTDLGNQVGKRLTEITEILK